MFLYKWRQMKSKTQTRGILQRIWYCGFNENFGNGGDVSTNSRVSFVTFRLLFFFSKLSGIKGSGSVLYVLF